MCKATGNSHHAPVSQPFLNFVLNWKFHTISNMGPKLRARKADEPSEELLDIRKKIDKLSKWLPGGEKCYIGINPNTSKPKGIAFNA